MIVRTYTELSKIDNYYDRFNYLKLGGKVGETTFGFERYVNQLFYHSVEWRRVRDIVIARDLGNDMGMPGYPISGKIYIHHMNVVRMQDLMASKDLIFDPDNLISVSLNTHNAIHYGDIRLLPQEEIERRPNDTSPWKT